jgi:hypothetical protein
MEASMKCNFRNTAILSVAILAGSMISAAQSAQPAAAQTGATPAASAATIPVDQQATKEQLTKLFEVMRVKQQMDSMMKMMPTMVQQQMRAQMKELTARTSNGKQLSAQEQAAIEELMGKEMDRAMHIVSFDEMVGDLTVVYQHHISRTDADAFIAFYSTPAGQHLLDAQPEIMKEYMPMVMTRVSAKTKELTDEMTKDMADLTKEYEQPAKTATPK